MPKLTLTIDAPAALAQLFEIWGQPHLVADVAPLLTCTELEALATVAETCGLPDVAEQWRARHTADDEEGDLHYQGDDEEDDEPHPVTFKVGDRVYFTADGPQDTGEVIAVDPGSLAPYTVSWDDDDEPNSHLPARDLTLA